MDAASAITARQVLELEPTGPGRFRSQRIQPNHSASAFGGQLVGQALAAAARQAPDKSANSLHAYFLRPGSTREPVDYQVEILREGRRLAVFRVSAHQDGKLIFHLHCSFMSRLPGFDHQAPCPTGLPGPEGLATVAEFVRAHANDLPQETVSIYSTAFPLEVRLIEPERTFFERLETPERAFWVRTPSAAEVDDLALHQCVLAFVTDYWLVGVAASTHIPMRERNRLQILSLDHAVWFHRPARADEWMLYVTDSPSAQDGRGLGRGLLYSAEGALIASTVQEGLFTRR